MAEAAENLELREEEFEEMIDGPSMGVRILEIAAGVVRFPPGMLRTRFQSSKAERKPTQLVINIAGYLRGDVEEKLGVSLRNYSVISFSAQLGEFESDYKIQIEVNSTIQSQNYRYITITAHITPINEAKLQDAYPHNDRRPS